MDGQNEDFDEQLDLFFGEFVIPKINKVINEISIENPEDIGRIIKEKVFDAEMMGLIESSGLDAEKNH